MKLPKKIRILASILIGFFIYALLYLPNSLCGGYWGLPVAGNTYFAPGMSFRSLFLWQPYFGYCDNYNESPIGLLYYPAIRFDQAYIHPGLDLLNTNDAAILFSPGHPIKWHPQTEAMAEHHHLEKAAWQSHCLDDPEFCLQSTSHVHTQSDIHFMARVLSKKYGTNALSQLQAFSTQTEPEFDQEQIAKVIDEVQNLNVDKAR